MHKALNASCSEDKQKWQRLMENVSQRYPRPAFSLCADLILPEDLRAAIESDTARKDAPTPGSQGEFGFVWVEHGNSMLLHSHLVKMGHITSSWSIRHKRESWGAFATNFLAHMRKNSQSLFCPLLLGGGSSQCHLVDVRYTDENREGNVRNLGLWRHCSAPEFFPEPPENILWEGIIIAEAIFIPSGSILTDLGNGLALGAYEFKS